MSDDRWESLRTSAARGLDQARLNVNGKQDLGGWLGPAQSVSNHIIESASVHVLALKSAGKDVSTDEPFAERENSVARNQIVISPAASIEALAVPPHGPGKSLDQAEQREKPRIEPGEIATD